ncbi:hypothetical protein RJT34_25822 [Clitoria ternatea]|uniref:Uncharacterized protein n=1 Tax=Clitoria ternatea TaxID=43366 RepID=A0AAN9FWX1_CLITE
MSFDFHKLLRNEHIVYCNHPILLEFCHTTLVLTYCSTKSILPLRSDNYYNEELVSWPTAVRILQRQKKKDMQPIAKQVEY